MRSQEGSETKDEMATEGDDHVDPSDDYDDYDALARQRVQALGLRTELSSMLFYRSTDATNSVFPTIANDSLG